MRERHVSICCYLQPAHEWRACALGAQQVALLRQLHNDSRASIRGARRGPSSIAHTQASRAHRSTPSARTAPFVRMETAHVRVRGKVRVHIAAELSSSRARQRQAGPSGKWHERSNNRFCEKSTPYTPRAVRRTPNTSARTHTDAARSTLDCYSNSAPTEYKQKALMSESVRLPARCPNANALRNAPPELATGHHFSIHFSHNPIMSREPEGKNRLLPCH